MKKRILVTKASHITKVAYYLECLTELVDAAADDGVDFGYVLKMFIEENVDDNEED